MSKPAKEKTTVGSAWGDFFRGGFGATGMDVIDKVASPDDKALPYLTEIREPVAMSVLDTLIRACERSDDEEVKEAGVILGDFAYSVRVNMKSHNRKGIRESVEGFVAVENIRIRERKTAEEKLFGEGR